MDSEKVDSWRRQLRGRVHEQLKSSLSFAVAKGRAAKVVVLQVFLVWHKVSTRAYRAALCQGVWAAASAFNDFAICA